MKYKTTLTFHGGAGSVTGANFLFDIGKSRVLVDCGLIQGNKFCEELNYGDFPYDPAHIDTLLVTHAHSDHIGRIPKLVRNGFRGSIISTPATKDIASVMFEDALNIMREESKEKGTPTLYDKEDIEKTLAGWSVCEYHESFDIGSDAVARFLDAGHILGSAMVEMERGGRRIVVTGDLGNSPAPVVKETEQLEHVHYLIIESVYGDRLHGAVEDRREVLRGIVEEVLAKQGTLLIPAFSLQRTQAVLTELNALVEDSAIDPIPVYLDAPLALRLLPIYRRYTQHFNERLRKRISVGDDPFDFEGLTLTPRVEESRAIASAPNPKIIIAGSGMSHGGRIRSHEKRFLDNKDTTILFIGYQSAGSLGRRIAEGQKRVRVDDKWVTVRADVRHMSSYSAHKDRDQLLDVVANTASTLEQVFVAMGEPKSAQFFAQRVNDFLGVDSVVPERGQKFSLEW